MAYRAIQPKFRYRHCRDLGVKADYCIVEYRYTEKGWTPIGTCHPAAIEAFKTEGLRNRLDLLKLASHVA